MSAPIAVEERKLKVIRESRKKCTPEKKKQLSKTWLEKDELHDDDQDMGGRKKEKVNVVLLKHEMLTTTTTITQDHINE